MMPNKLNAIKTHFKYIFNKKLFFIGDIFLIYHYLYNRIRDWSIGL